MLSRWMKNIEQIVSGRNHFTQSQFILPNPTSFYPIPIHFPQSEFIIPNPNSFSPTPIHFPQSQVIFSNPNSSYPIPIHFTQSQFILPNPNSFSPISIHFPQSQFIFPNPNYFPHPKSFSPIPIHFPQSQLDSFSPIPIHFPNPNSFSLSSSILILLAHVFTHILWLLHVCLLSYVIVPSTAASSRWTLKAINQLISRLSSRLKTNECRNFGVSKHWTNGSIGWWNNWVTPRQSSDHILLYIKLDFS